MDQLLEDERHSLAQLSKVKRLIQAEIRSPRQALFLATQLVNHGCREAEPAIERFSRSLPNPRPQEYLHRLAKRDKAIQSLRYLETVQNNQALVNALYQTTGWLFVPGAERRETAVVIFTTAFNNFNFSNVVLCAFLRELGVSQLFLKDTTPYWYFRGVSRLAQDMLGIPGALGQILSSKGIEKVIVTGFSSGGYPSLFAASSMHAMGYVGFSVTADLSRGSSVPHPKMYDTLRDDVPEELQMDLSDLVSRNPFGSRYTLFFGDSTTSDKAQAHRLSALTSVKIFGLENCGHQTTSRLVEEGKFLDPFRALCDE